jgi:hypothetical protein
MNAATIQSLIEVHFDSMVAGLAKKQKNEENRRRGGRRKKLGKKRGRQKHKARVAVVIRSFNSLS